MHQLVAQHAGAPAFSPQKRPAAATSRQVWQRGINNPAACRSCLKSLRTCWARCPREQVSEFSGPEIGAEVATPSATHRQTAGDQSRRCLVNRPLISRHRRQWPRSLTGCGRYGIQTGIRELAYAGGKTNLPLINYPAQYYARRGAGFWRRYRRRFCPAKIPLNSRRSGRKVSAGRRFTASGRLSARARCNSNRSGRQAGGHGLSLIVTPNIQPEVKPSERWFTA